MASRISSTGMLVITLVAFSAICCISLARAEDWPCWRGPHRDGISRRGWA
jgi:hypothetical protein